MLTKGRFGQETVDQLFVSVRAFVSEKYLDLFLRRRQPGEIQRNTSNQGIRIRFLAWRKPLLFQAIQHKSIDDAPHLPRLAVHFGHLRIHRLRIGPMKLVIRALLNPLFEKFGFLFRKALPLSGRRHHVIFIVRHDSVDQFAVLESPRYDGGKALPLVHGPLSGIEP